MCYIYTCPLPSEAMLNFITQGHLLHVARQTQPCLPLFLGHVLSLSSSRLPPYTIGNSVRCSEPPKNGGTSVLRRKRPTVTENRQAFTNCCLLCSPKGYRPRSPSFARRWVRYSYPAGCETRVTSAISFARLFVNRDGPGRSRGTSSSTTRSTT